MARTNRTRTEQKPKDKGVTRAKAAAKRATYVASTQFMLGCQPTQTSHPRAGLQFKKWAKAIRALNHHQIAARQQRLAIREGVEDAVTVSEGDAFVDLHHSSANDSLSETMVEPRQLDEEPLPSEQPSLREQSAPRRADLVSLLPSHIRERKEEKVPVVLPKHLRVPELEERRRSPLRSGKSKVRPAFV